MTRKLFTVFLFSYVLNEVCAQTWQQEQKLPSSLGEVAAAAVNGLIYVVGQGTSATYQYNPSKQTWSSSLAKRPYAGDHHSVIVPDDGTFWLVGGLSGAEGQVTFLSNVNL